MSEKTIEERRFEEFYQMLRQIMADTYIKLDGSASDGFRMVADRNGRGAAFFDMTGDSVDYAVRTIYDRVNQGWKYYFFAPGESVPHALYYDHENMQFRQEVLDPSPVRPTEPTKPSRLHRFANAITFGRAYKAEMDTYKGDMTIYETELENYNNKMGALEPLGERLAERKQLLEYSDTINGELAYKAEADRAIAAEKARQVQLDAGKTERKTEIDAITLSEETKTAARNAAEQAIQAQFVRTRNEAISQVVERMQEIAAARPLEKSSLPEKSAETQKPKTAYERELREKHEQWLDALRKRMNEMGVPAAFDGSGLDENRLYFGKAGEQAEPVVISRDMEKDAVAGMFMEKMQQGYRLYGFAPGESKPTAFSMDDAGQPKWISVPEEKPVPVPPPDKKVYLESRAVKEYELALEEYNKKIEAGQDPSRVFKPELDVFQTQHLESYEISLETYQRKYLPVFREELAEFENAVSVLEAREKVLWDVSLLETETALKQEMDVMSAQRKEAADKWSEGAMSQMDLGSREGLQQVMIVRNGIVKRIPDEYGLKTEYAESGGSFKDRRVLSDEKAAALMYQETSVEIDPKKVAEYLAEQLENGNQIFVYNESEKAYREISYAEGGAFLQKAPENGDNFTAAQEYVADAAEVRERYEDWLKETEAARAERYAKMVEERERDRQAGLEKNAAEGIQKAAREMTETFYAAEEKINAYKGTFALPDESFAISEAQGRAIMTALVLCDEEISEMVREGEDPMDLAREKAEEVTFSLEEGNPELLGAMVGNLVPHLLREWDHQGEFTSPEWSMTTAMLADVRACLELPGVKEAADLSGEMLEKLDEAKTLHELGESYRQIGIDLLGGNLSDPGSSLNELVAIRMLREDITMESDEAEMSPMSVAKLQYLADPEGTADAYRARAAGTDFYRSAKELKDPVKLQEEVMGLISGEKDVFQTVEIGRIEVALGDMSGSASRDTPDMHRTAPTEEKKKAAEL